MNSGIVPVKTRLTLSYSLVFLINVRFGFLNKGFLFDCIRTHAKSNQPSQNKYKKGEGFMTLGLSHLLTLPNGRKVLPQKDLLISALSVEQGTLLYGKWGMGWKTLTQLLEALEPKDIKTQLPMTFGPTYLQNFPSSSKELKTNSSKPSFF